MTHKDFAEHLLANKGLNELSVDAQVVTHALLAVVEQLEELSCVVAASFLDDEEEEK